MNLFGDPPEVIAKPNKIINSQLDNKQLIVEVLDTVQKIIKHYRSQQNTSWSMEEKKTWRHSSSITQPCQKTKHKRKIEK